MTDGQKGVMAMAATGTVWGLSGIYYKLVAHVPPLEVLAHRSVWSLVFFLAVLWLQGRLGVIRTAFADRKALRLLVVTALTISVNWFGFIFAIQSGHATEASLGYYIFPLVAAALGFAILRERFSRLQLVAVTLAAVAVVTLSVGLGDVPWIALMLAGTFGLYGLLKKLIELGPVVSVTIEVILILPLAGGYLALLHAGAIGAGGGAFGGSLRDSLLLGFSGVLTGLPLVLFAYAARRVSYTTLGLVQYLNPTLQFLVAVLIFGEAFTSYHAVAFPLIWGGLALYSADSLLRERRARRAATRSGTSVTTSR